MLLENLRQDLRLGLRQMLRRPGFTAAALLTLTLGIGANAAVFSLVQAILLRDLPYAAPQRLLRIWRTSPDGGNYPVSILDFQDLSAQSRTLEMASLGSWGANLTGSAPAERLQGWWVDGKLFRLLGLGVQLGRPIEAEDAAPGAPKVAVLGHGFWQRRFGADPDVLGQTLRLNGEAYTIVGVLSTRGGLPTPNAQDVVVPLCLETDPRAANRGADFLQVIGRLRPGVTQQQASAELQELMLALREKYPETNRSKTGMLVEPLHDSLVEKVRSMLLFLQGAVGLVLLAACANLAGLLLARAGARRQELAVRASLGASRGRLVRQMLSESLLLTLCGGALGLLLALWGVPLLLRLGPENLPRAREVGIDGGVLLFALGASALCALLVGLVPALHVSGRDLQSALRGGAAGLTSGRRSGRLRSALVAAEVALALVLLVGAGLLIHSFLRLQMVEPGYRPDRLLTLRLSLPKSRYRERDTVVAFHERLEARLQALAGVESAAAGSVLPTQPWRASISLTVDGHPELTPDGPRSAYYRMVSPSWFGTLGIPVLRGRTFEDRDRGEAPAVALINQTLAQRLWPDANPIGARLRIDDGGGPGRVVEVVGVVGDIKHYTLEDEPSLDVYVPFRQVPPAVVVWLANSMAWVVRTQGEPLALSSAVLRELEAVDADVPASAVQSMEQALAGSMASRRFNLVLLQVFAAAALLLAVTGIYGVSSTVAAQRTREVGIRIALGARPRQVQGLLVGAGLVPVLAGLALGAAAAYGLGRLVASLLYGVGATDPATFAAVAALLLCASVLASWVPARKASRIDPARVLRSD